MSKQILFLGILLTAAGARSGVFGATLYDESVSGDLSNNGLTPSILSFTPGSNVVKGTTGNGAVFDRDYFTFAVPQGSALTALVELANTTVGGTVSFIGIQQGTAVTVPTNAQTAAGLLGWSHYGGATTDTDILPAMSVPNMGSTGFSGSLGPGSYAVWIQDFNTGTFSYSFDFRVNAVPEPGTLGLGFGALALFAFRSRGQIPGVGR